MHNILNAIVFEKIKTKDNVKQGCGDGASKGLSPKQSQTLL